MGPVGSVYTRSIQQEMDGRLEFSIALTWDGQPHGRKPAKIALREMDDVVEFSIYAPFYNDAPPPGGKVGEPYMGLWDYEVVEAFFLNSDNQYLEVEFGPHGQHILLMLDGTRNVIKHSLPVDYKSEISIDSDSWTGVARIPKSYFPPGVDKFNAYAIHGPANDRKYEALYEVSGPEPDFHRLHKFQNFPLPISTQLSDVWKLALEEAETPKERASKEFLVGLSWDGKQTVERPAVIHFRPMGEDLEMVIEAPFYDDPAPPGGQPGKPYFKLWEYEVVEAFFLNAADQYLELEFGPHGQHLMLLLNGNRNAIKHSLPMKYQAKIDHTQGTWTGTAIIPGSYFPPKVTKFNGYAIHEVGDKRRYEAVFESSGPQPDFHRLEKFQPFNLSTILPTNNRENLSDIWKQAIADQQ